MLKIRTLRRVVYGLATVTFASIFVSPFQSIGDMVLACFLVGFAYGAMLAALAVLPDN